MPRAAPDNHENYCKAYPLGCHSLRNLCICTLTYMTGHPSDYNPRTKILKRMTVRSIRLCDSYFRSNLSCRARHPIIMKNYNSAHSLACHSFRNLCTCILIHMNGQLGALHPRTKILKRMTVRSTRLCDSYFRSNDP